jgi:hypothetical protein
MAYMCYYKKQARSIKMENCVLLNSLKDNFFKSVSMLDKIIEFCPNNLWNRKVSGYVFWQQLVHTFAGMYGWLRDDRLKIIPPFSTFNGKKIYSEFENDPEIMLTKEDIIELFNETKESVEKWFNGKDDDWLKSPFKQYKKWTNLDNTIKQISHIMYHVGHFDSIFRENRLKGVWNE